MTWEAKVQHNLFLLVKASTEREHLHVRAKGSTSDWIFKLNIQQNTIYECRNTKK